MSSSNPAESKGRRYSGSKGTSGASTPPSPRRSWIKMGVRARSVENIQPMSERILSPASNSPPLTLATGSPAVSSNIIPASPLDTPPKKLWESGFKSFLSRRSQPSQPNARDVAFPEVPVMSQTSNQKQRLSLEMQNQNQVQHSSSRSKGDNTGNDQSVRGGKMFQSIFGGSGSSQRKNRKTKSLNQLDEPMRNGKEKNYSPDSTRYRRVQSQANVLVGADASGNVTQDELGESLRRASYAGTSAGAIIPPPPPQYLHHSSLLHPHQHSQHSHLLPPSHPPQHHEELPSSGYHPYGSELDANSQQHQLPFLPRSQSQAHTQHDHSHQHQEIGPPIPNFTANSFQSPLPSGSTTHSMSPSSATTEIKKAFTEFHNSSRYARDSTSPYLGDEPSTRRGDAHCTMCNPALVEKKFSAVSHFRNYSNGNINSGSGHHFLSSSLPTVDENVSIHKSLRILRPFQMVDSWQSGRRYLIGPAAMATCPLLQGTSTQHNSSIAEEKDSDGQASTNESNEKVNDNNGQSGSIPSPAQLPPLFGSIVLGKALLSYVAQEPIHHHQQRWWSSCILILRQNYLLEYDQQSATVMQGLPRGYAHLQYAKTYAHADFADALELEFFVSPCAKADKRVLTIRLQETREKRDNWIACINRAAEIGVKDMYDYDESVELGKGRYATIFPAKRRAGAELQSQRGQPIENGKASTPQSQHVPQVGEYDCALKIIDKKEFWRRVVKGRERADTIVRETSVQATMTSKCSKIPAFVRLRGFLETSDHIVLELELLEGMDLFQYVSSKGVLSEKEAACILRDILSVLDGLNRLGVAHRDIKPANCLMCKASDDTSPDKADCVAKVADFGMATFVGLDGLVRGRCGTPGYVAPEIFSAGINGGYGNKVDIFSSGVTLYVMLCGYEPFYGESDEELVAANKAAKLDFPTSDWKNVSSEAKELVKCMMETDPKKRLSAKEALRHPWIVKHAGVTDSVEVVGHRGVDSLSHSLQKRGESCTIS